MGESPRKRKRKVLVRRNVGVVAAMLALSLGLAPQASAATLYFGGGTATHTSTFTGSWVASAVTVQVAVTDATDDAYCVHARITPVTTFMPFAGTTLRLPDVCGRGAHRRFTVRIARKFPAVLQSVVVRLCRSVPSGPVPCAASYVDNPLT
ncbi:MAG TPA: hypothetical protein VEV43_15110 [Actinomycetota bacterium]|nr:hypothetical protein [Actinomycetota bacterium]